MYIEHDTKIMKELTEIESVIQGRPWLTRGPVRGMEWGPPRSVCDRVTGGVGFRGARGPVRPHQLHRPKDGPGVIYC